MKLKKLSAILTAMLCMGNILALQGSAVSTAVGDTNTDGIVNAGDASEILIKSAQIGSGHSTTEEEFAVMDINNDGKIGADDAGVVLQYSANAGAKSMPEFSEYVAQRLEEPVFHNAQYIRHDGTEYYNGETNYIYQVITCYEDFENFISKTCETAYRPSDLENTLTDYNTEFFETHDLIVVGVEEGSGSIRHEVQGITADENNNWTVIINCKTPLCGTDDMASWAIFVETNKAVEFANSVTIDWIYVSPDYPVSWNATKELSKGIQSQEVTGKNADEDFINGQTKFALELFQNAVNESDTGENIMVSPYSVVQALGMTANGASGETKTQMEQTIGSMPIEDLNQYLYTQRNSQPNDETCKLLTANSIWVRDDSEQLQVKDDFLQTNADYYNASVFKAPFDDSTVKDINKWVKKNTDDMIPELLNEIPEEAVMYLINAVTFDGKWKEPYLDVRNRDFTTCDGTQQTVKMMESTEYNYLEDENTTGFYKYYQDGRYAFAALLPNEDISINDYITNLTPESFQNLIANPEQISVRAGLPKFSYDYKIELSNTLSDMGMPDAFSENADFSRMAETSGQLSISKVLHKTHIDVFEEGTKAAAVTAVEMVNCTAVLLPEKSVVLDRPFVYAIVDTETNLPMFMGVLNSVE